MSGTMHLNDVTLPAYRNIEIIREKAGSGVPILKQKLIEKFCL
jgi:hypothetical protein